MGVVVVLIVVVAVLNLGLGSSDSSSTTTTTINGSPVRGRWVIYWITGRVVASTVEEVASSTNRR